MCLQFFELYGEYFSEKEKKLIIDACKLHDIGKANYIFQTKVNPKLKKEKDTSNSTWVFKCYYFIQKSVFAR